MYITIWTRLAIAYDTLNPILDDLASSGDFQVGTVAFEISGTHSLSISTLLIHAVMGHESRVGDPRITEPWKLRTQTPVQGL